ncbi:hypothetical protein AV530_009089 [Patagioenas fasciata monilis]|uniref:Uncharacterized protein n=1 Tax=Patagioenas fasciata monilis TaxID=372326 RepID=A0A1V4L1U3_PATFA|nr:hypothetical protein AV530_009089 [Patagioenas fasciata monilis]
MHFLEQTSRVCIFLTFRSLLKIFCEDALEKSDVVTICFLSQKTSALLSESILNGKEDLKSIMAKGCDASETIYGWLPFI